MFYDLNLPWLANDSNLLRTLAFLHELGYNAVALNHTISGKLPNDLTCPIPNPLSADTTPPNLTILRRCTLVLTDSHTNARLTELARTYDLLAVRPIDERTFTLACTSLDCDIISLDLTQRLPFWFRYKTLAEAVKSGKRLELCYAQGLLGDAAARRNLISNATQLIRASRGRGLVVSSEARSALGCRGPWDVINLAAVWGLAQDRGFEAVSKDCRSVVVAARLKRTSYRGVIDVVDGGDKPPSAPVPDAKKGSAKGVVKQAVNERKRKAEAVDSGESSAAAAVSEGTDAPMSKRQKKRLEKEARLKANGASPQEKPDGKKAT